MNNKRTERDKFKIFFKEIQTVLYYISNSNHIIIENLNIIQFKTNILEVKYEENNISAIIDISYINIYHDNFFIK